ncbi:MAG: hypothetical protein GXO39_07160 [Thermotogae bacterium]|nr:hypothetical protein [Thermotogota bacterium]
MFSYRHEIFFTLLLVLYSLSFALIDPELVKPALILASVSITFFPIYAMVTKLLKKPPLKSNLLLPLSIGLAFGAITNAVSFKSSSFFAIMLVTQVFILAIGFFWTAYEFAREKRLLQFFLTFLLWGVLLSFVDALYRMHLIR